MGRKRIYADDAAKQKAYRDRKRLIKSNVLALLNEIEPCQINNPPVRYYGGKWRIADWIIDQFPPHVCYCEPFCGGASILFSKFPSSIEVINDLNSDIVNFFGVLRTRLDDLLFALALTPQSREEQKRAYSPPVDADPIERARLFYIRSRQSFGSGEARYNTGWRFARNDKRGVTKLNDEWNNLTWLIEAAKRLKRVQIEHDDAIKVIRRFDDPDTLFYVDPPYLLSLRNDKDKGYSHEMSDDQHRELAELLHSIKGMALVSGYESDLYDEIYRDWRCIKKHTKTQANYDAIECLWISPSADAINRLPLFANLEKRK